MTPKDTKCKIVMHWIDENGVKRPVAELDDIDFETVDKVLSELEYVRVVRCKDCRFFSATWDGFGFCKKLPRVMMREYDYCSYGERRN